MKIYSHHRQLGVALISVLIVAAMVSISASWLLKGQHISIKRTTQIISQEQAVLHVYGAENLVAKLLQSDKNNYDYYTSWYPRNPDGTLATDRLQELWSRDWKITRRNFREFENLGVLQDIEIQFCVQDMNGLINVNLLHRGVLENKGRSIENIQKRLWNKETFTQTVLLNLFKSSYLGETDNPDTPTPQQMVDALSDWFDEDNLVRPEGSENSDYLDLEPPYRTSAMRFVYPEEIYLVKGFNRKTMRDFKQYLTAIPYSLGDPKVPVYGAMNINTMPTKLLAAMPGLSSDEDIEMNGALAEIESYRRDPDNPPFKQAADVCSRVSGGELSHFCKGPETGADQKLHSPYTFWTRKRLSKNKHYIDYIRTFSQYFAAAIKVKVGGIENEVQTMFYRNNKKVVSVVQRRFGKGYYEQCQQAKSGLVRTTY